MPQHRDHSFAFRPCHKDAAEIPLLTTVKALASSFKLIGDVLLHLAYGPKACAYSNDLHLEHLP